MDIKLTTPQELVDKANQNKEETGFHHKELPKLSFWYKWTEKIKAFYLIFRFKGF